MALFGRENKRDKVRAQAYASWLNRQNPFAVASLALGVVSLIEFGVLGVFGIGGIVLGVVALRQLASADDSVQRNRGHRLAWAGIIASVLSLAIAALIYSGAVPRVTR
jgi:ABC-type branched-subunit amino acid transport system permease subunit